MAAKKLTFIVSGALIGKDRWPRGHASTIRFTYPEWASSPASRLQNRRATLEKWDYERALQESGFGYDSEIRFDFSTEDGRK